MISDERQEKVMGENAPHYVITISREFGSLGRPVAMRTAELLGIYFMDRDIVEQTAKRMGLPVSEIGNQEETAGNKYFYQKFPLGIGPQPIEDEIFETQSNIIRDEAKKENCIIVGRCAEYVLLDHVRKLSVYIHAPYEWRLRRCIDQLQLDGMTANKMIHDVDLARERYRRRYMRNIDGPFTYRDLILDTSVFGVENTARIIAQTARIVFNLD